MYTENGVWHTSPVLHAKINIPSRFDAPCIVFCSCGYSAKSRTLQAAQGLAWAHDEKHWALTGTAADWTDSADDEVHWVLDQPKKR